MRFCQSCGAPVTNDESLFCDSCGARLEQPTPEPSAEYYQDEYYEPAAENAASGLKNKIILIVLGAVLAVVILMGAIIIGTYSSAQKSLKNRDYDKAAAQFERFPFFSSKAEDVRLMQANELLKDDKYFEAARELVKCNSSKADTELDRCTEEFFASKPSEEDAFDYLSEFSSYISKDMKTALQNYIKEINEKKAAEAAQAQNPPAEQNTTPYVPEVTEAPTVVTLPSYNGNSGNKYDRNSYYSFFAEHSIVRELGGDSYLSGWTKDEIQYEINYLLATHGYIFKNDKWKNYFYQYNWYHPVSSDMAAIVGTFNSTELENYEFLGRYRDAHFK